MSLYNLPDEILLIIFNYCDVHDIIQLNGVCKRFYSIASEILIKEESNHLLITGQMSKKFRERCQPLLSLYKEKFSIHYNWKNGKYKSKIFYPKPVSNRRIFESWSGGEKYRNRLQMTKDVILFVSDKMENTNNLCAFNRTKNGLMSDDNVIVAKCSTEILDIYVPRNDVIVTYHEDSSIRQWTIESLNGKNYFNEKLLCSACSDYYSFDPIDVSSQNIIRSSMGMKGEIEIWKYVPEENSMTDKYIVSDLEFSDFNLEPYVDFITFDPTGTKFIANIHSAREDWNIFEIYDMDKGCTVEPICIPNQLNFDKFDFGYDNICQILWTEPNDILCLAREKIKKVDARTHKIVQKWNAPFRCNTCSDYYEIFTCMSSDNQYAIMTGTSYGKLILWDQRQNDFIQVYNKDNVDYLDCLQFDSSRMYVAADKLYEFDFTKI